MNEMILNVRDVNSPVQVLRVAEVRSRAGVLSDCAETSADRPSESPPPPYWPE